MRRGTTPTHTCTIPSSLDVSTLSEIYITYSQFGRPKLEKTKEDITIDGQTLTINLSQAETLSFKVGKARIQLRAVSAIGKAYASDIKEIQVEEILKDGEI